MVEFYGDRLEKIPAVLIAKRVSDFYKLKIPFDLRKFAEDIVKVLYLDIPIQKVDGVVLNLKTPGKDAKILINTLIPAVRQRFTLAHELGHYFIPWHIGSNVGSVHADYNADFEYTEMELEANSFAAELLMPSGWLKELFQEYDSLGDIHNEIVKRAEVSALAAAFKMLDHLPSDYLFVETDENGIVNASKSSYGSTVRLPSIGDYLNKASFNSIESYSKFQNKNVIYHWFGLTKEILLSDIDDDRDWRCILHDILLESDIPEENRREAVQSVNGVIGWLFGKFKGDKMCTRARFKAACMARFSNKPDSDWLSHHKDFELFLDKKIRDLFS